jgi:enterochelin esterase-like enzyme
MQQEYDNIDKKPLKIFLSFGNKTDNSVQGLKFMQMLSNKKYDLTFRKNNEGHNWENWRPLIDDALLTFFATQTDQ